MLEENTKNLSINKNTIEMVGSVFDPYQTIETKKRSAVAFFEPAAAIGATSSMLSEPRGAERNNPLHVKVRNWAYSSCAVALVGEDGLDFLKNRNWSGEAEWPITQGKMKGQKRSKKYIQQQVGKLIGLIKRDLEKAKETQINVEIENAERSHSDSFLAERTHYDSFLDSINRAAKFCAKAEVEGSIPGDHALAFNEMMEKIKLAK